KKIKKVEIPKNGATGVNFDFLTKTDQLEVEYPNGHDEELTYKIEADLEQLVVTQEHTPSSGGTVSYGFTINSKGAEFDKNGQLSQPVTVDLENFTQTYHTATITIGPSEQVQITFKKKENVTASNFTLVFAKVDNLNLGTGDYELIFNSSTTADKILLHSLNVVEGTNIELDYSDYKFSTPVPKKLSTLISGAPDTYDIYDQKTAIGLAAATAVGFERTDDSDQDPFTPTSFTYNLCEGASDQAKCAQLTQQGEYLTFQLKGFKANKIKVAELIEGIYRIPDQTEDTSRYDNGSIEASLATYLKDKLKSDEHGIRDINLSVKVADQKLTQITIEKLYPTVRQTPDGLSEATSYTPADFQIFSTAVAPTPDDPETKATLQDHLVPTWTTTNTGEVAKSQTYSWTLERYQTEDAFEFFKLVLADTNGSSTTTHVTTEWLPATASVSSIEAELNRVIKETSKGNIISRVTVSGQANETSKQITADLAWPSAIQPSLTLYGVTAQNETTPTESRYPGIDSVNRLKAVNKLTAAKQAQAIYRTKNYSQLTQLDEDDFFENTSTAAARRTNSMTVTNPNVAASLVDKDAYQVFLNRDNTAATDIYFGNNNSDMVTGQTGSDRIYLGSSEDFAFGGSGKDFIFGQAGADIISGGAGIDKLFGGDGEDHIYGTTGDFVSGGSGRDRLDGVGDQITIFGGSGDDIIVTGPGESITVLGGDGGDTIQVSGSRGAMIHGGAGVDKFTVNEAATETSIYGGEDRDQYTINSNNLSTVYFENNFGSGEQLDAKSVHTADFSNVTEDLKFRVYSSGAGLAVKVSQLSGLDAGGTLDTHSVTITNPAAIIYGRGANLISLVSANTDDNTTHFKVSQLAFEHPEPDLSTEDANKTGFSVTLDLSRSISNGTTIEASLAAQPFSSGVDVRDETKIILGTDRLLQNPIPLVGRIIVAGAASVTAGDPPNTQISFSSGTETSLLEIVPRALGSTGSVLTDDDLSTAKTLARPYQRTDTNVSSSTTFERHRAIISADLSETKIENFTPQELRRVTDAETIKVVDINVRRRVVDTQAIGAVDDTNRAHYSGTRRSRIFPKLITTEPSVVTVPSSRSVLDTFHLWTDAQGGSFELVRHATDPSIPAYNHRVTLAYNASAREVQHAFLTLMGLNPNRLSSLESVNVSGAGTRFEPWIIQATDSLTRLPVLAGFNHSLKDEGRAGLSVTGTLATVKSLGARARLDFTADGIAIDRSEAHATAIYQGPETSVSLSSPGGDGDSNTIWTIEHTGTDAFRLTGTPNVSVDKTLQANSDADAVKSAVTDITGVSKLDVATVATRNGVRWVVTFNDTAKRGKQFAGELLVKEQAAIWLVQHNATGGNYRVIASAEDNAQKDPISTQSGILAFDANANAVASAVQTALITAAKATTSADATTIQVTGLQQTGLSHPSLAETADSGKTTWTFSKNEYEYGFVRFRLGRQKTRWLDIRDLTSRTEGSSKYNPSAPQQTIVKNSINALADLDLDENEFTWTDAGLVFKGTNRNLSSVLQVEVPTLVTKLKVTEGSSSNFVTGGLTVLGAQPKPASTLGKKLVGDSATSGQFEFEQVSNTLGGGHRGYGQINLRVQKAANLETSIKATPDTGNVIGYNETSKQYDTRGHIHLPDNYHKYQLEASELGSYFRFVVRKDGKTFASQRMNSNEIFNKGVFGTSAVQTTITHHNPFRLFGPTRAYGFTTTQYLDDKFIELKKRHSEHLENITFKVQREANTFTILVKDTSYSRDDLVELSIIEEQAAELQSVETTRHDVWSSKSSGSFSLQVSLATREGANPVYKSFVTSKIKFNQSNDDSTDSLSAADRTAKEQEQAYNRQRIRAELNALVIRRLSDDGIYKYEPLFSKVLVAGNGTASKPWQIRTTSAFGDITLTAADEEKVSSSDLGTSITARPIIPNTITTTAAFPTGLIVKSVVGSKQNDVLTLTGDLEEQFTIKGGAGDDLIFARSGSTTALTDILEGGPGNDVIVGGQRSITLRGDNGDDLLIGSDSNGTTVESIDGGPGRDVIIGNAGNDDLNGGLGSDIYSFDDSWGHDVITEVGRSGEAIYGDKNNHLDFSNVESVRVALSNGVKGAGAAEIQRTEVTQKFTLSNVAENALLPLTVSGVEVHDLRIQNTGSAWATSNIVQAIKSVANNTDLAVSAAFNNNSANPTLTLTLSDADNRIPKIGVFGEEGLATNLTTTTKSRRGFAYAFTDGGFKTLSTTTPSTASFTDATVNGDSVSTFTKATVQGDRVYGISENKLISFSQDTTNKELSDRQATSSAGIIDFSFTDDGSHVYALTSTNVQIYTPGDIIGTPGSFAHGLGADVAAIKIHGEYAYICYRPTNQSLSVKRLRLADLGADPQDRQIITHAGGITFLDFEVAENGQHAFVLYSYNDRETSEAAVLKLPRSGAMNEPTKKVFLDNSKDIFVSGNYLYGVGLDQYGSGLIRYNEISDSQNLSVTQETTTAGTDAFEEVQSISHNAVAGTFTLTYNGSTTTALNWNAEADTVKEALNAVGPVGSTVMVGRSISGDTYTYTITFAAPGDRKQITIDTSDLPGGSKKLHDPRGQNTFAAAATNLAYVNGEYIYLSGQQFTLGSVSSEATDDGKNYDLTFTQATQGYFTISLGLGGNTHTVLIDKDQNDADLKADIESKINETVGVANYVTVSVGSDKITIACTDAPSSFSATTINLRGTSLSGLNTLKLASPTSSSFETFIATGSDKDVTAFTADRLTRYFGTNDTVTESRLGFESYNTAEARYQRTPLFDKNVDKAIIQRRLGYLTGSNSVTPQSKSYITQALNRKTRASFGAPLEGFYSDTSNVKWWKVDYGSERRLTPRYTDYTPAVVTVAEEANQRALTTELFIAGTEGIVKISAGGNKTADLYLQAISSQDHTEQDRLTKAFGTGISQTDKVPEIAGLGITPTSVEKLVSLTTATAAQLNSVRSEVKDSATEADSVTWTVQHPIDLKGNWHLSIGGTLSPEIKFTDFVSQATSGDNATILGDRIRDALVGMGFERTELGVIITEDTTDSAQVYKYDIKFSGGAITRLEDRTIRFWSHGAALRNNSNKFDFSNISLNRIQNDSLGYKAADQNSV
ncbi:MAG: hypothetical protein CL828_04125, partial [Crocinitomicaceae bacterium]|nr:hypothetical protein [Crocinitomicaceae bacterium]